MSYENHMGFIYSGPIPDLCCAVCGKVLASFATKECSPGRTMHKDKEKDLPRFSKDSPPLIERKTCIVCPEHQAQLEDKGYYLAYWWSTDGIINGTK